MLQATPLWEFPQLIRVDGTSIDPKEVRKNISNYYNPKIAGYIPEAVMTGMHGSNWISIEGAVKEPACYHLTPIVRKHAIHIAEHKDIEKTLVWEEPCGNNACCITRILIFWKDPSKIRDGSYSEWLDVDAVGNSVEEEFPDWKYVAGTYAPPHGPREPHIDIKWHKDRWGIPYTDQKEQKITPRSYEEYLKIAGLYMSQRIDKEGRAII